MTNWDDYTDIVAANLNALDTVLVNDKSETVVGQKMKEVPLVELKKFLGLDGPLITAPRTSLSSTTYTQLETDAVLRLGSGGTCTVTLLDPTTHAGWWIVCSSAVAQLMVSASSNVTPKGGGAAGTAILPATAGAWADLQSNGTSWLIIRSGT